jgi:flagellar biosynthesis protein FliR
MPNEFTLSLGTLLGFLLVLARVAGVFVFVPLPGLRNTPEPVRVVLVLAITLTLFPRWPVIEAAPLTAMRLTGWVLAEATTGLVMGIGVAVLLEAFSMGAQALGVQAGYAYASTVDPNTQADSGVLNVLAELTAGMLFFAAGFDREVLRLMAASFDRVPAGAFVWTRGSAELLIRMAAGMFTVGLRLALPVIALLLMVDLALALLGRLNAQLQLLSLAFPVKMLVTLALLSWGVALYPRILNQFGATVWLAMRTVLG